MEVLIVGALLALALLSQPQLPAETVVLLPGPDGRVGTVIIERSTGRTVLNEPYASSRAAGARETQAGALSEQQVRSEFGNVLAALPARVVEPPAPSRAEGETQARAQTEQQPAAPPARPVSFLLYFGRGQDELTEESKTLWQRVLEELRARPQSDIVVIGHTDRVGAAVANDELSLQRAERVKADLVAQGIVAERIRAAGRGEREPLVPTADGVEEPRNRRVEVSVR
ncbi:MAG TPA: OmpA family protein [Burkholderiales bacterium]|nr:OmpA family protein [Burkholderiales bacterium]